MGGDVKKHGRTRYADFKCHCGEIFQCAMSKIKSGHTSSCGCNAKRRKNNEFEKHGMAGCPEYWSWINMLGRCYNPNVWNYNRYGGVGITVCERWRRSFTNFFSDMGAKPSKAHTLDRWPNSSGNYEPSNCRWASKKEQVRNRKVTVKVMYNGEELPLSEWVEKLGLNLRLVRERICRWNWDVKDAFEKPIEVKHRKKQK